MILFYHEQSNVVHEGNLLGEEGLGAQNDIVNWCFARGWVHDTLHVRLKVLKPAMSCQVCGLIAATCNT